MRYILLFKMWFAKMKKGTPQRADRRKDVYGKDVSENMGKNRHTDVSAWLWLYAFSYPPGWENR